MFCPQCGTKLVEGSRFCYRCGCRLADYVPDLDAAPPPRTVTHRPWDRHDAQTVPAEEPRSGFDPLQREEDTADTEQDTTSLRQPVILIDLSHKERIHEDHWSALRARLHEEGRVALRSRRPVNPALLRSKKLLLIGGPEHRWVFGRGADRWQDEEVRAIERFVARGNALWVMGDGLCDAEALGEVTAPYGITFSADPVGGVTVAGADVYRHRLTRGVDQICLGSVRGVGGNYLKVEEPAIVLAEHDGRPVMAYCEHEHGRVLVLSNLAAFSQRHIEDKDNAILLSNTLQHLLHFEPPPKLRPQAQDAAAEVKATTPEQPPPPFVRAPSSIHAVGRPSTSAPGHTAEDEPAEAGAPWVETPPAAHTYDEDRPWHGISAPAGEEYTTRATEEADEDPQSADLDEDDDWDDAYA